MSRLHSHVINYRKVSFLLLAEKEKNSTKYVDYAFSVQSCVHILLNN